MANQFTVTFGSDRSMSPMIPYFKKMLSDTSTSIAEIISLNPIKECRIIEVIFEKEMACFEKLGINSIAENGIKDGVTSLSYYFNVDPITLLIFSNDTEDAALDLLGKALWDKDKEIMGVFASDEIAIEYSDTSLFIQERDEVRSKLKVAYSIWRNGSSIEVEIKSTKENTLLGITIKDALKNINVMVGVCKKIISSITTEIKNPSLKLN
jgi:hypothetical protein